MDLAHIDTNMIRPPKFVLRPVRMDSVEYMEMLDSIQDHALWQPILVRPMDNGNYEVVEGNWRYTCCKQLGMATIPCVIKLITDDEVMVAQLQSNGIRPETTPVEFAARLAQLLHSNIEMTVPKLSILIRKSPTWITQILRLQFLRSEYSQMLRRGEIPLTSACALARLPHEYQDTLVSLSKTMRVREFTQLANKELKLLRETSRNAYIDNHQVNQAKPVPNLRKVMEIRSEFKRQTAAGPTLLKMGAKTAIDGWNSCLAWILHMDPDSLVDQETMIEDRRNVEIRAAERRRKERRALQKLRLENNETTIPYLETENE